MRQPKAKPKRTANSICCRFARGKVPGCASEMADVCVFGSEPNCTASEQNAFDAVANWTWTSRPMMVSYGVLWEGGDCVTVIKCKLFWGYAPIWFKRNKDLLARLSTYGATRSQIFVVIWVATNYINYTNCFSISELYTLWYKIHNSLVVNVRGTFKVPRT